MTNPTEPKPTGPAMTEGEIDACAMSIARLVDEWTDRGWNDIGRAKFARLVVRRLKRFWPLASARAAVGGVPGRQAAALTRAAIQFRSYALQHDAKGTQEGRDKAEVNRRFETMCLDAIDPTPPEAEGAVGAERRLVGVERRDVTVTGFGVDSGKLSSVEIGGEWFYRPSPSPTLAAEYPSREEVARAVDPEAWAAADDLGGGVVTFEFQKPSLAKADAIIALFPLLPTAGGGGLTWLFIYLTKPERNYDPDDQWGRF